MCTVVALVRPGHAWPVILGANRDEMLARAWDPPGPHWPERPGVVAGRDRVAGGTWLGVNRHGVIAAVLNRPGSLGPAPGRRSRGGLPLAALDYPDAARAVAAIAAEDAAEYRSFNMVVADRHGGWFIRGLEAGRPEVMKLAPGVQMVTAHDPNDTANARTARHLPRFRAGTAPNPGLEEWRAWESLLADRSGPPGSDINAAERGGFGTICSSLLAIPARGELIWRFAPGPPDRSVFAPVALPFAVEV